MTITSGRIDRLERAFGAGEDDIGPLVIIAPNAWPDADRAAYDAGAEEPAGPASLPIPDVARLGGLTDGALDAIERQAATRPRATAGHICVIDVPAPEGVAQADEETRAAWRAAHERPAWRGES